MQEESSGSGSRSIIVSIKSYPDLQICSTNAKLDQFFFMFFQTFLLHFNSLYLCKMLSIIIAYPRSFLFSNWEFLLANPDSQLV